MPRLDLSEQIEEGHAGCLCPLCDNPIDADDKYKVVNAHGNVYLVHADCVELEDDEEDGE
jgi:hypothetical protein